LTTQNPSTPPERNNPKEKPASSSDPKPKKKLELDVNDVDAVLERKISP
jgi:hypothetical protein